MNMQIERKIAVQYILVFTS